jgi:hypothetical protein
MGRLMKLQVDYRDFKGKTHLSIPGHDPDKKYEFGMLISFAYPIENSGKEARYVSICFRTKFKVSPDEEIIVATTRPETMLGDAAVAVHPDDMRYKVNWERSLFKFHETVHTFLDALFVYSVWLGNSLFIPSWIVGFQLLLIRWLSGNLAQGL